MMKTVSKDEFINIGCASDDKYAQHMGVMIYSLLKNCSCPAKIRFFVLSAGISEENKGRLTGIARKFNSKIGFIAADISLLKDLKTYRHLGIGTYLRFVLIEKLNIKKLIFLDCDIVVKGDIEKLFGLEFEDNIVFAVKDPGISKEKKKILGLDENKPYFNAGVLLIDCERWKSSKVTRRSLDYLQDNPQKIEFADQDALNTVLSQSWKQIDPEWNVITRFFYSKIFPWIKIYDYSKEEIERVNKNPKIIHYATTIKPWFFLDVSPLKKTYWSYLKKTPWKDYRAPDSNFFGICKRVMDYIKFILSKYRYLQESRRIGFN